MSEIRDQIVSAIRDLTSLSDFPVVIAIDGGSGAGKSSIAELVRGEFDAAVVPLDDFYSAHIPDSQWKEASVEERLLNVLRWSSVREDVLMPLKIGKQAKWFSFDFNARRSDGTYAMEEESKVVEPADIVILEGAYSASPHLEDLVDFSILIDVPTIERHARLDQRQDEEFSRSWHEVWDEVEEYYFGQVRPKGYFDLVVSD